MDSQKQPIEHSGSSDCSSAFVFCLVVALAIYGLCQLMDDTGIVVHRNGEAQFWFEEDLRSWIHGRSGEQK